MSKDDDYNNDYYNVNIRLLGCVDKDDVDQICGDANIDIEIDTDSNTVTHCADPSFLMGVIAALMHDPDSYYE